MKVVYIEKKNHFIFCSPQQIFSSDTINPPKKNPKAAIEPNTNTNTNTKP